MRAHLWNFVASIGIVLGVTLFSFTLTLGQFRSLLINAWVLYGFMVLSIINMVLTIKYKRSSLLLSGVVVPWALYGLLLLVQNRWG